LQAGEHLIAILSQLDGIPEAPERHLQVTANFHFVFAYQYGFQRGLHGFVGLSLNWLSGLWNPFLN
jgi:hypothetical protein